MDRQPISKKARFEVFKRLDRIDFLEHLVNCGFDIDEMERRAKRSSSIDDFEVPYDAALAAMGKPF